jgi:hypothetical protein
MSSAFDNCVISGDFKQSLVNIAEIIVQYPHVGEEEVIEAVDSAKRKMHQKLRDQHARHLRSCKETAHEVYCLKEELKSRASQNDYLMRRLFRRIPVWKRQVCLMNTIIV